MAEYLAHRDGGKTDEAGLYHFLGNLLTGVVISTGWKVSQRGAGPNMSIDIAAGDAKIDSGSGYSYLAWSDAVKNVAITTADATNPRNDIVVAYIDKAVVSSTNPNNPNALKFIVVAGTPAGSPADPSGATIQAAVGAGNPYTQLARVRVGAGVTSITDANITDLRSIIAGNFNVGGSDGWIGADETWTYLQNNGQREYQFTISGDKTGKYSKGMRVKVTRSTAPPTQSLDLELGSSQYANKTTPAGLVFTDDFTCEAWIKLESYGTGAGTVMTILGKRGAAADGYQFRIDNTGTITLYAFNGTNYRAVSSYQAPPLGRWVHVAAVLDMSAVSGNIYIDGVAVPAVMGSVGTPSTLVQGTGNLAIGTQGTNVSELFDGKIADVRLWAEKRTATNIRENMNQQLVGTETNLVGYWKLNGNFNDSTTNANNMTGQAGAVATNVDNPMQSTEYGIIHDISYSSGTGLTTVTIFTGTDYNLPNMTLSTPYYSLQKAPYGFNSAPGKWRVESLFRLQTTTASNATFAAFASGGWGLNVPRGDMIVGFDLPLFNPTTTPVNFALSPVSITGVALGAEDLRWTARTAAPAASNTFNATVRRNHETNAAQTQYLLYTVGAVTTAGVDADNGNTVLFAESPYA